MYSAKRALFSERTERNSRQAAVQLVVRMNIIGTTKSVVNLETKANAIIIIKTTKATIIPPNMTGTGVTPLAAAITAKPMTKRIGSPIAAKPIKNTMILKTN